MGVIQGPEASATVAGRKPQRERIVYVWQTPSLSTVMTGGRRRSRRGNGVYRLDPMDGRALAATVALNQDALLLKQLQSSNVLVGCLKPNFASHGKLTLRDQSPESSHIGLPKTLYANALGHNCC